MSTPEKQWEYKGYSCKVILANNSHRCGYVKLPKNHIAFGINYNDIDIDVHGGLTYSSVTDKGDYWVGFDCAHSGDKTLNDRDGNKDHFWILEEVVVETNKMVDQLLVLKESQTLSYDVIAFLKNNKLDKIIKLKKEIDSL